MMSVPNRNSNRPPIVFHSFDLTGLGGMTPEKQAEKLDEVAKQIATLEARHSQQPNESANLAGSSKLPEWPKTQKTVTYPGKEKIPKCRVVGPKLDDVRRTDSHDWNDSGFIASTSSSFLTEVTNKKNATKSKYNRKAKSVAGKWLKKRRARNAKEIALKSRKNISRPTQNVGPRDVQGLEDSANGKRKYSEAEVEGIRAKRRKWLETRETDSQWIKCCHETCGKWRLAFEYEDAAEVPEIWYCSMNRDPEYASCDVPEEKIPKTVRAEMIESPYSIGSILWARLDGYPWWPAIVDECPASFQFCRLQGLSTVPFEYHVVFIDMKHAFRAWVGVRNLKVYKNNPRELVVKKTKFRNVDYRADLDEVCALADEATSLTVAQRIKKLGWAARSAPKNGNKMKPTRKSQRLIDKYVLKDNRLTREQEIEREKAETTFKVGDIVWAEVFGQGWWPAMVDTSPIQKNHIRVAKTRRQPSMYHVVYFNDKKIEYDWISEDNVQEFPRLGIASLKQKGKSRYKGSKRQLEASYKLAMEANRMSLERRLLKFGLSQRLEQQLLANGDEGVWSVPNRSPPYYEDEEEKIELADSPVPLVSDDVRCRPSSPSHSKTGDSNISVSNYSLSRSSRCKSNESFSSGTKKSWEYGPSTSSGKSQLISSFFFPKPDGSGTHHVSEPKKLRDVVATSSWDSNDSKYRLRSRSNSTFSSFSEDPAKFCDVPLDQILASLNDDHDFS